MFDDRHARERLEKLWKLPAVFGKETGTNTTYLNEIVSDRYQLVGGLQLLRDELQLAVPRTKPDMTACGADLTIPSVVSTMAFTTCGDRIHQGEVDRFRRIVGNRFATISEVGDLKMESFSPAGGGTDDGATLAHVTVGHQLDEDIRRRLYQGNKSSFVLVAIDLKTHVGRLDVTGPNESISFGETRESAWREPRTACGAIVGALRHYNEKSRVHQRIRNDLGSANFELLRGKGIHTREGIDISYVVAAAIVALRGAQNTAHALTTEMDERGLGHLTACVTINRTSATDTLLYLGRVTVFGGEIRTQGLGLDAEKYTGNLFSQYGEHRLALSYDGYDGASIPVESTTYTMKAPDVEMHFEDL